MTRFGYTGTRKPKEIDLRKELDATLFGSSQEIPKAHHVLVRKRKVDSEGRHLPCACNFHNEGSKSPSCSLCLGDGYYWTEEWRPAFKQQIGSESAHARRIFLESGGAPKGELTRFYFRYPIDITKDDKIVEVKTDANGDMVKPYERKTTWMIQELVEKRSDNGRLEFVIAYCSKHNVISDDYSRR